MTRGATDIAGCGTRAVGQAYARNGPGPAQEHRGSCRPDIQAFDFLKGGDAGSRKAFFANGQLSCTNEFLLRPTPRNIAIVFVHAGSRRLSRGLAMPLYRFGLRQRIRQTIRRLRPAR